MPNPLVPQGLARRPKAPPPAKPVAPLSRPVTTHLPSPASVPVKTPADAAQVPLSAQEAYALGVAKGIYDRKMQQLNWARGVGRKTHNPYASDNNHIRTPFADSTKSTMPDPSQLTPKPKYRPGLSAMFDAPFASGYAAGVASVDPLPAMKKQDAGQRAVEAQFAPKDRNRAVKTENLDSWTFDGREWWPKKGAKKTTGNCQRAALGKTEIKRAQVAADDGKDCF